MSTQLPDLRAMAAQVGHEHGLPSWFVNQIAAESNFDPNAQSPAGAQGLGQLMPATAKGLGVTNPLDPRQNLEGAAQYLEEQYRKFGRWDLALAAYNAGPGAVAAAGNQVPNIAETQNYVKKILGDQTGGGDPGLNAAAPSPPPATSAPSAPSLTDALKLSMPSPSASSGLGDLSAEATKEASKPITLPQLPSAGEGDKKETVDKSQYELPTVPITSGMKGAEPMHVGGDIKARYPNIIAQNHVDWQHVNPRLLESIQKVAEKRGLPVVIFSGYRDNKYSAANGGFTGDPHTRGIAVDAYINGHPIGDVVPPEEWAKLGIRSGNTPGFYKGKPDPEHLDLVGIPIKTKSVDTGGNK